MIIIIIVVGTSRTTAHTKLKEDEEDFDNFLKSVNQSISLTLTQLILVVVVCLFHYFR